MQSFRKTGQAMHGHDHGPTIYREFWVTSNDLEGKFIFLVESFIEIYTLHFIYVQHPVCSCRKMANIRNYFFTNERRVFEARTLIGQK